MSGLFGTQQTTQASQTGTSTSAGGVSSTGTNSLVNASPTGVNPGLLGQYSSLLSSGAPGYFGTIGGIAAGSSTNTLTGLSNPGASSTLQSLLATGNPTNVGPAWQTLVGSQNQQATQGAQQIASAYGSEGLSYGSGLGSALQNYQNQLSSGYANTLSQYTMTAQENAANRQAGAVSTQAGIQQNNLMAQLTAATTGAGAFGSLAGQTYNPGSTSTSGSTVATGSTTNASQQGTETTTDSPSLFSDIGNIAGILNGILLGVVPGYCWIGRALWGEHDPRPVILRWWLHRWACRSRVGLFAVRTYIRYGERVSRSSLMVKALRPLFILGLHHALEELYVRK